MNISEVIGFHSKLNPRKMCAFETMMFLVCRSWRENVQNPTICMQDFVAWELFMQLMFYISVFILLWLIFN